MEAGTEAQAGTVAGQYLRLMTMKGLDSVNAMGHLITASQINLFTVTEC